MIEAKGLTKYYGSLAAIEDVTFQVKKGEILGFLGPNGAGKTTTLRILTSYLPATRGEARVAGYDVFRESLEVRRRVGYLPENVPLYNDMRVGEYLSYRAKMKEIPPRQREKRMDDVLEKCRIGDVRRRIIGQLSKGYKQRVGLAGALIHNPEVLILDEPTLGLDPNQIRGVRNLIKELGGKHTILLSTHILPEVEMVCQRVIIINKGKLAAMGSPETLRKEIRGAAINLEVKGEGKRIKDLLQQIEGVSRVTSATQRKGMIGKYRVECEKGKDLREEVFRAIVQGEGIIRQMDTETVSLEDIFVQLTREDKE